MLILTCAGCMSCLGMTIGCSGPNTASYDKEDKVICSLIPGNTRYILQMKSAVEENSNDGHQWMECVLS